MSRCRSALRAFVVALSLLLVLESGMLGRPVASAQQAPTTWLPEPVTVPDPARGGGDLRQPGILAAPRVEPDTVVETGAYTETVANADGTFTTRYAARPLHWRDASGAWQDFINEVRPLTEDAAGFDFGSAASGFTAGFNSAADVAAGSPALRFAVGAGGVELTAVDAAPTAATVEG